MNLLTVALADEWVVGSIGAAFVALAAVIQKLYRDKQVESKRCLEEIKSQQEYYESILTHHRAEALIRMEHAMKTLTDLTTVITVLSERLKHGEIKRGGDGPGV